MAALLSGFDTEHIDLGLLDAAAREKGFIDHRHLMAVNATRYEIEKSAGAMGAVLGTLAYNTLAIEASVTHLRGLVETMRAENAELRETVHKVIRAAAAAPMVGGKISEALRREGL